MKTTHTSISKMKSAILGLTLFISTGLLLTSCQKEESQPPSSDSNSSQTSAANNSSKESPTMAFTSIKIDHIAAKSLLPDYSVTVNSNGTATYEGRRNVYIKGNVDFKITSSSLWEINNVCMGTNFFKMRGGYNSIPDMPGVETTFTLLEQHRILSDYEGLPAELVSFRTKIEKALDLSRFINAPAGTAVAIDKM